MGYARLAVYILGLILVVMAAWVFLTQTPFADEIPPGVALAIILFLVGLGVMVAANSINDARYSRRVYSDGPGYASGPGYAGGPGYAPGPGPYYGERVVDRRYETPPGSGETVVEERRFD